MIAEELGGGGGGIGGCSMGKRDRDKKREHEGKITAKEKKRAYLFTTHGFGEWGGGLAGAKRS